MSLPSLRRRRLRGNAAIEFALAGTVLLVLLFGLMEWGWYLFQWFGANRASQAGARMAAVATTDIDPAIPAATAAQSALSEWGIDPDSATIETSLSGETGTQVVTVRVTVDEPALIGLVPAPEDAVGLTSQHYEEVIPLEEE